MKEWKEYEFSRLQSKIENSECFGRKISLSDNDCFTLMTAYLIGVRDCLTGYADEYDTAGLILEEDKF
jgi:hypothetical protein